MHMLHMLATDEVNPARKVTFVSLKDKVVWLDIVFGRVRRIISLCLTEYVLTMVCTYERIRQ